AAEALGKLGDRAATAKLLPLLRTGTPTCRQRVCESLWRLADTSAVDALIASLGEKDRATRWRVVYALEKLPLPARVVPAVTPLLRDPDPLVRAHAARTLGREKSPLATGALMATLDDGDAAVVVNAVRSLQQVGDGSVSGLAARVTGLLAHRDPYVRVTAATALADSFVWAAAGTDSTQLRDALIRGFDDSDFHPRRLRASAHRAPPPLGPGARAPVVRRHRGLHAQRRHGRPAHDARARPGRDATAGRERALGRVPHRRRQAGAHDRGRGLGRAARRHAPQDAPAHARRAAQGRGR